MTIASGIVASGITKSGTTANGLFIEGGGIIPPPPVGKIFKALNGDLFISIDDKLFTSL